MIQFAIMAAIAVWFSVSARKFDQNAFLWAGIGVGSYYVISWLGISVVRLFFGDSISSKPELMTYVGLTYAVLAVTLVCVFLIHRELVSRVTKPQDPERSG